MFKGQRGTLKEEEKKRAVENILTDRIDFVCCCYFQQYVLIAYPDSFVPFRTSQQQQLIIEIEQTTWISDDEVHAFWLGRVVETNYCFSLSPSESQRRWWRRWWPVYNKLQLFPSLDDYLRILFPFFRIFFGPPPNHLTLLVISFSLKLIKSNNLSLTFKWTVCTHLGWLFLLFFYSLSLCAL